jgi:hypothetical protein
VGREERTINFRKTEVKYFCGEDWTGQIRLKLLGKIAILERRFLPDVPMGCADKARRSAEPIDLNQGEVR